MFNYSIKDLSSSLLNKKISSVELAQLFLERINQNKNMNAFTDVRAEETLKQAERADIMFKHKKNTLLTGIPIGHKDIFVTTNFYTTAGSKMLQNYLSPFNATVVENLENVGMVTLGKLNCDEFAMGSSNENSYYGNVKNPWDKCAVPGGSSGGSAAAVSARLCPVATATDTGGSIREPASFTGVTGLKPTYGLASRWGMVAFASSLDQAGLMAKNSEDIASVLNFMLGHDNKDSTSVKKESEDYNRMLNNDIKGIRIGIPKEFFSQKLNIEVEQSISESLNNFKKLGADLVDISLPHAYLGIPVYYVLAPAECSSNLSRYDGIRYGYRVEHCENIDQMIKDTRSIGFGKEVKRRVLIGTYVLSHGYYDSYYLKAQKVRNLISIDFKNVFKDCDIIISPVTSSYAFDFGEKTKNPVDMYKSDFFTIPASLAGLPAMSIPCGISKSGRPIGLQLISNHFDEARMLGVAHQFQINTDWHLMNPPLITKR